MRPPLRPDAPVALAEPIGLVDLPVSLMGLLGLSFQGSPDGADLSPLLTEAGAKGKTEALMVNLKRPLDGFTWGGRGEVVD